MPVPSLEELMKAGVYFGHQKSKWHPKMAPFIFGERNGVQIINLEETQKQLEKALAFLSETVKQGGTVLFLGTKKQAQALVKQAALDCGMPYVISRWLGGTLTNASSILKLVDKYRRLKADKASGKLLKFTKKEQLEFDREIERLDGLIGGMESISKIPDALFVVDVKEEKTAIREARRRKLPVVALCDTNVNPTLVDYPVPSNDDAVSALKLMITLVADTIKEARPTLSPAKAPQEPAKV